MAVAFDAVGPSSAGASATGAASLTWSHTCGGSANAIIAGSSMGTSPDTATTTATYAGVTMTPGAIVHSNNSTQGYLRVFTLLSPATGANNVIVTLSSGSADLVGGSISATGVASFKAQHSAFGAATPATVTSSGSTSDGLIAAFCCTGAGVTSATAPSTSRWLKNLNASSAAGNAAGATSPGTGSNVTTAWTISSDWWAAIGVELLAAAGTAPTHQASTGVLTSATAQGTTSVSVAYPAGVAANRKALLFVCSKLSGTTHVDPAGWTLVGTRSGGTGAAAADAGTTRISVWEKDLIGSESGSVTVTCTGADSSAGAMSIYTSPTGAWAAKDSVTAIDTAHGTNPSGATSVWAAALAVDDLVVVGYSNDTDVAKAPSAFTMTQTGTTYGAATHRNQTLSTSGNDSGVNSWDALVTAGGSTNALTTGMTSAVSQCGSFLAVRLRAAPAVTAVGDTVELDWSVAQALGDPLQTVWHTAKAQGDTLQAIWNVSIPVADTVELPWAVRQTVGQADQLIWTVAQAVGDSSVLRWNVAQAVGDPLGLIWNVSTPVADTLDVRWATAILAGDSAQLIWHVRGLAGVSPAFVWNTLEAVTPLGDTLALVWSVQQAVGDPVQLVWTTSQAVSDTLGLAWAVRAALADQLGIVWNVAIPVSDTLGLIWVVRQAVGDPLDLRWTVHQAISDLLGIVWDVEAAAGVVGDSLELSWDVRAASAASVQVLWQDLVPVSDLLALRWNISISASDTLGLQWSVKAATASLLDIKWSVSSVSGETISLLWQDLAAVNDSLGLQWTVKQALASLLDIKWDTESDIETISVAPDLIYAHGKLHLLVDDFLALQL